MISLLINQHQMDTSYIKVYLNNIKNDPLNKELVSHSLENIEVLNIHLEEILGKLVSEIENLANKLQAISKQSKYSDIEE